eukprot:2963130-Prorocentrum_lima.AAC.1
MKHLRAAHNDEEWARLNAPPSPVDVVQTLVDQYHLHRTLDLHLDRDADWYVLQMAEEPEVTDAH